VEQKAIVLIAEAIHEMLKNFKGKEEVELKS
jgi:hypothetical protein